MSTGTGPACSPLSSSGWGCSRGARPLRRVLLSLHRVKEHYRRRTVLAPVDLTVRAGEVAAVVGTNGCGKSTLLRICAGLTAPPQGWCGAPGVGYVPRGLLHLAVTWAICTAGTLASSAARLCVVRYPEPSIRS